MGNAVYRHSISIEPSDIDFMGHVNNASYLKWVQDAVLGHWRGFAPAETEAAHLWVALKHEITYRRPAFLTDEITAVVSLQSVRGVTAFYDTIIRRGEEIIAEVKSRWCCLHAETRRPARITTAMLAHFTGAGRSSG
ncbi:acyl-CoA thioesterase [uncultured Sphingomonas sp.]|uniref:acyl-CoA thioesterase n=1 Tax=uncultured Sphingomonas sp. TaxID=158754 RepID=UPI0035CC8EDB